MAWYVEHRGRIRAILSGLLVGEIRPKEESGCAVANPTIGEEMVVDIDRSGYKLARV